MTKGAGGVLVSDVRVGSLVIGAETTVADLANAVIALNDGWQAGDQLTFFYGVQTTDAVTGIPRARIYGYKVMLNPGDSTPLLEVVNGVGFTSVASAGSGFVLGMDRAIEDGAAVWIHSREDGTGGLKVSTQFMYVDSSVLAGYQTSEAMAGAANSYGGINAQAVYLQPRAGRVTVIPAVVPAGGSTGSGGSGSGTTDSGNGGSTEPSGGGSGNDNPPAGDGSGDEA